MPVPNQLQKTNSSQGLFSSLVTVIQEKSGGGKMFSKSEINSEQVTVKFAFLILQFLEHCWAFDIYGMALYHTVFQILIKKS